MAVLTSAFSRVAGLSGLAIGQCMEPPTLHSAVLVAIPSHETHMDVLWQLQCPTCLVFSRAGRRSQLTVATAACCEVAVARPTFAQLSFAQRYLHLGASLFTCIQSQSQVGLHAFTQQLGIICVAALAGCCSVHGGPTN